MKQESLMKLNKLDKIRNTYYFHIKMIQNSLMIRISEIDNKSTLSLEMNMLKYNIWYN